MKPGGVLSVTCLSMSVQASWSDTAAAWCFQPGAKSAANMPWDSSQPTPFQTALLCGLTYLLNSCNQTIAQGPVHHSAMHGMNGRAVGGGRVHSSITQEAADAVKRRKLEAELAKLK